MNARTKNIHASCILLNQKGILLLGKSGAGKSDLALRLIENKKAELVADDRVDITVCARKLYATSPETLKGLIEVRGIGIVAKPYYPQAEICLAVELVEDFKAVERLPQEKFWELFGVKVPLLSLYPFESSAADKIVIKLKALLD